MECPNCKENYKFYEVPLQNRNMKFLVTEFLCPYCGIWLKPDRQFSILSICYMSFFLLSIILFIIGVKSDEISLRPALVFFVLSIAVFVVSNITLRVEAVTQNSDPS